jgi:hypothetical protein
MGRPPTVYPACADWFARPFPSGRDIPAKESTATGMDRSYMGSVVRRQLAWIRRSPLVRSASLICAASARSRATLNRKRGLYSSIQGAKVRAHIAGLRRNQDTLVHYAGDRALASIFWARAKVSSYVLTLPPSPAPHGPCNRRPIEGLSGTATRRSEVGHPPMCRKPGTRRRIGRSEHQDRRGHRQQRLQFGDLVSLRREMLARTRCLPALCSAAKLLVSDRIGLHFPCGPGTLRGFPAALRREGM